MQKNGTFNEEGFALCQAKGYFPYEHYSTITELKKAKELPPKECFASKLTRSDGISQEEWNHAQKFFQAFEMGSMYAGEFL